MKFNWGHGIALAYGTFAVTLIAVVIKTTQYDHSLVTKEYYEKDLAYQEQYDKMENSQHLKQPVKIWKDETSKYLSISFPDELKDIHGEITFYRPSDSDKDFTVPFQLEEGNLLEYDTKDMLSGLWTIKIDWQSGQTPYYQEMYISI
ncbi:MAG: FixH family protein [Saprospiraceae bacterium]|nr:FixH family protein [Lewinella sp.]